MHAETFLGPLSDLATALPHFLCGRSSRYLRPRVVHSESARSDAQTISENSKSLLAQSRCSHASGSRPPLQL